MKHIVLLVGLFAGCLFAAEKSPRLDEPPLLSEAKAKPLYEKELKEREAAIARLPPMDQQRMEFLVTTLRQIKYPITFEALRDKLGGPDALVWCCTIGNHHEKFSRMTSTYRVARRNSDTGDYIVVVDFIDSPSGGKRGPLSVSRARLCYDSPFGWRFAAESTDDLLRVGSPENVPNQSP